MPIGEKVGDKLCACASSLVEFAIDYLAILRCVTLGNARTGVQWVKRQRRVASGPGGGVA